MCEDWDRLELVAALGGGMQLSVARLAAKEGNSVDSMSRPSHDLLPSHSSAIASFDVCDIETGIASCDKKSTSRQAYSTAVNLN